MAPIPWGKFPTVAEHQLAHRWLQFTANIGRALNTIDAYGRAVEDHLRFCAVEGTAPLLARADTVAAWIRGMLDRPLHRPTKGPRRADAGLANAAIQQRLYLVEDGCVNRTRSGEDRQAVVVADPARASYDTSNRLPGFPTRRSGDGS